ncbi:MAG: CRISPR-associated endonuclease Cas3'' [Acidihalobacter sp.]|uniref:CRISPR-associated endonuclease Cas3'' n=1 Tax=Acidihalobacter sp. TaxID=1872108 RepID=UPI00307E14E2
MVADRFFAHSGTDENRSDWQPLAEHLHNVGRLAGERAARFGMAEAARAAGLLHDLGKYTDDFQRRIAGDAVRVDHATHGAILAVERYGQLGHLLAYGIAGHHAGLANGAEGIERTALRDRLRGAGLPPLLDHWRSEIDLPDKRTLALPLKPHSRERSGFQFAFLARMLFSCLVDADFLDTEAYYDRLEGRASVRDAPVPSLHALRDRLDERLARFEADTEVNCVRAGILRHVRRQAECDPGLFSLTVPTGGGKTLASLAFALDHAIRYGQRRVIFVIPFTSIVEQNAGVFREALGPLGEAAVLEHHSAFFAKPPRDEPEHFQAREKLRLAMENWDAPIVVTTAVQFFESLFAAKPSRCRKLHNIADSVVILDEAQTLPLKLLRPAVAAVDELARNYRSSIVLCTATQPALSAPAFAGGLDDVRELAPEPPRLFRELERVRIRHAGVLDDETLSDELRRREQVLCIVNNRRHARAVYQSIADLPGARHLSTLMCAKHRSAVLKEIYGTLERGEPCRLVSTSLIEAGVDISLPTVLRAEAGLDSIAQAAGRCNRNKEWPVDASEVLVFATANEDWAPPPELRQFAEAAQEILRQPQYRTDPLSPSAIQAYFELLYWQKGGEALDAHNLLGIARENGIDSLPMETLAAKFRMIESGQMPVIVPYDDDARETLKGLRNAERSGGFARKLQPYLVQMPPAAYDALCKVGAVQPVALEKWGEQFMELVNKDIYDVVTGLSWDNPTFIKAGNTIL